jgi:ArsR family transcriptional regulator
MVKEDIEQSNIDVKKINKIKANMIDEDKIFDIAEFFKVFGDSTRMKIISALLKDELCVGEIAIITNSTQSAISHQLRILKQAKLVKYRKDGKTVYYSLDDDHIFKIYKLALDHAKE